MDVRSALKQQYHGGLAMLREAVEVCPDDVWTSGTHPRKFWRIAFHALFYTHLYLGKNEEAFHPWEKNRPLCRALWDSPEEVEPYTKSEILEYVELVDGFIDSVIDELDLDTLESGFDWYPNISKLSHQIMNVRHLQGHVGQLSELLMAHNIDIDWVSRR